jgi:hypothetical protein
MQMLCERLIQGGKVSAGLSNIVRMDLTLASAGLLGPFPSHCRLLQHLIHQELLPRESVHLAVAAGMA